MKKLNVKNVLQENDTNLKVSPRKVRFSKQVSYENNLQRKENRMSQERIQGNLVNSLKKVEYGMQSPRLKKINHQENIFFTPQKEKKTKQTNSMYFTQIDQFMKKYNQNTPQKGLSGFNNKEEFYLQESYSDMKPHYSHSKQKKQYAVGENEFTKYQKEQDILDQNFKQMQEQYQQLKKQIQKNTSSQLQQSSNINNSAANNQKQFIIKKNKSKATFLLLKSQNSA